MDILDEEELVSVLSESSVLPVEDTVLKRLSGVGKSPHPSSTTSAAKAMASLKNSNSDFLV